MVLNCKIVSICQLNLFNMPSYKVISGNSLYFSLQALEKYLLSRGYCRDEEDEDAESRFVAFIGAGGGGPNSGQWLLGSGH